jgi:ribosomal protein RSM22 (predicted rRNA methylase)
VPLSQILRQAIEQEVEGLDRRRLSRAAEQITSDYNGGNFGVALTSAEARAAYLITRLPATYAACESVFAEVARRMPEFAPLSLLDLGAGPGTSAWAATEFWPSLRDVALVEGNREFVELGKRLAASSDAMRSANWKVADLSSQEELPSADVVVISYAIGELKKPTTLVERAWNAAKQMLVIIEPGTPRNFGPLAQIRRELIAAGAHIIAPCPHHLECPMAVANDWCHFSVRLERTAEHRRMKGGALGYEDEKFSYVVFSKQQVGQAETRIVRHPMTHSGYIRLTLCTPEGLQPKTVTRSQKQAFRAARRAKWGDEWRQLE